MKKVKIDKTDKKIYYPMSFNEQMAWIDEIVENLLQSESHKQLDKIQKMGKETYSFDTLTYGLHRLFEIIRSDPKNKNLLRKINQAERELISFLYHEEDACSESEIFSYWNQYVQAYYSELESGSKAKA